MDISNLLRPSSTSDLILPSKPSVSPQRPSEQQDSPTGSLIPCILDLEAGSSTKTKSREKSSNASKRYRNRNRENQQLWNENKSLQQRCDKLKYERDRLNQELDQFKSMPSFQKPERPENSHELGGGQELAEKKYSDGPTEPKMCPACGGFLSSQ